MSDESPDAVPTPTEAPPPQPAEPSLPQDVQSIVDAFIVIERSAPPPTIETRPRPGTIRAED
jgi:hypothetical protein